MPPRRSMGRLPGRRLPPGFTGSSSSSRPSEPSPPSYSKAWTAATRCWEKAAPWFAAGRLLLHAAQRADEVRRYLTLEHIADMLVAIAGMHGDTAYLEPIL
jgi:hypothetical protein